MGIDPGLAIVGYGLIEKTNTGIIPLDYGVVNTPKQESTAVRLAIIDECISGIINKYKPEAIALEELFFTKNVTSGISVAMARGVILLNAVKHCGQLFEYTPNQVKIAMTGMGNADKKQMQYMVKNFLRLRETPQPDDAADALAVAICHANSMNLDNRNFV